MEELIPIQVLIAGRSYRIRVEPKEEELVRVAVEIADDKIKEFRQVYAGKDDQDFVAMTLITFAIDALKPSQDNKEIKEKIETLIQKIDTKI